MFGMQTDLPLEFHEPDKSARIFLNLASIRFGLSNSWTPCLLIHSTDLGYVMLRIQINKNEAFKTE